LLLERADEPSGCKRRRRAVLYARRALRSATEEISAGVALMEGTTREGVRVRGALGLAPLEGGECYSPDHCGPVSRRGCLFVFRLGRPLRCFKGDPPGYISYTRRCEARDKWHAFHKLLVSALATEVLTGVPLIRWVFRRLPHHSPGYPAVAHACLQIKEVCMVARRWALEDVRDPDGDRRTLERAGLSLSRAQALQFSYWGRALPAPILDRQEARRVAEMTWAGLHLRSPDPRYEGDPLSWRQRCYRILCLRPTSWRWNLSLSESACLEMRGREGGQRGWLLESIRHGLPPSSYRDRCLERREILLRQARDMAATEVPVVEVRPWEWGVDGERPEGMTYRQELEFRAAHEMEQPELDASRRQAEAIYWSCVGHLGPYLDHAVVCPFWSGGVCQEADLHPPTALLPLPEDGFKTRVATLHEAALIYVARAWSAPGFATLRSMPSERNGVVGEPVEAMALHLGGSGGRAVSLDLTVATDRFSMFAARDVLLALTTPLRRGVEDPSLIWSPLEDRSAVCRLLCGPLRPVERGKMSDCILYRSTRVSPREELLDWWERLASHTGRSRPPPAPRVPRDRSGVQEDPPRLPLPVPYIWERESEMGAGVWTPLHPGAPVPQETRPLAPLRVGHGGYDTWVPLDLPLTTRGVSMALGCHWPSMALVGADSSRLAKHLGCGDDGLDIGSRRAHEEARLGREQAGFERHPGKEIVSDRGALIKEVPFRRHPDGVWRVDPLPLKVRVLAGEGDPETGVPRFIQDFSALEEECSRSGTPWPTHKAAEDFLLKRYGRPLFRMAQWGVGVPGYPNGWRDHLLSRPVPDGAGGPPLARPGLGGSRATPALIARAHARHDRWAGSESSPMGPLGRDEASRELTWEVFSSYDVLPGKSPGPETLPQMMDRLRAASSAPLGTPGGLATIGPKVVGVGGDFPVGPISRFQRQKAFRRQRNVEKAS
jgi:hypothetical protein